MSLQKPDLLSMIKDLGRRIAVLERRTTPRQQPAAPAEALTVAEIYVAASEDASLMLEPGPQAANLAPVIHAPAGGLFGAAYVELSVALGPVDLPADGLFTIVGFTDDPLLLFVDWHVVVSNAAGTERLFGASGWESIDPIAGIGLFHSPDADEWVNETAVGSDLAFGDMGTILSAAGGLYWVNLWARASGSDLSP